MRTAYITDFTHHTTLAHAPVPHKLHPPAPHEKPAPAPPPHPVCANANARTFSVAPKRCANSTTPPRDAFAVLVLAPAMARCTSLIAIPATQFRQPASTQIYTL